MGFIKEKNGNPEKMRTRIIYKKTKIKIRLKHTFDLERLEIVADSYFRQNNYSEV